MKNTNYALSILLILTQQASTLGRHAVTTGNNRGRLGNWLVEYTKAQWFCHEYGYTFLYKPFPHSSLFALHDKEQKFTLALGKTYKRRVLIDTANRMTRDAKNNTSTLYTARIFTNMKIGKNPIVYSKEFRDHLRERLAPRHELELVTPPADCKSVALHVRTGGNAVHLHTKRGDRPIRTQDKNDPRVPKGIRIITDKSLKKSFPYKFAPVCAYVEPCKKIRALFPNETIYCYIFTDDENPQAIARELEQRVACENMTFAYRANDNAHNKNIIEDLHSMAHFDILVRGEASTFPMMSEIIGDHELVISLRKYAPKPKQRKRKRNTPPPRSGWHGTLRRRDASGGIRPVTRQARYL